MGGKQLQKAVGDASVFQSSTGSAANECFLFCFFRGTSEIMSDFSIVTKGEINRESAKESAENCVHF